MKPARALPALPLLAALACGCSPDAPPPVAPERMVAAYAELTIASQEPGAAGSDSAWYRRRTDSALAAAGVTREELQRTLAWYNQDVRRWRSFHEQVARYLEERIAARHPDQPPGGAAR